ncbi:MAG TPA: LuxR C-terminal-related transcriptional regulator [Chitinophagales bacterium]|nr:LuxR C-terminal-related transcriptional regulator [Chitinophagales bacterium]
MNIQQSSTIDKLSDRETEILQHMADGLSSRIIATVLGISEDTVETHRKNIYRKIDAKNAAQATAYGFRNNIIK